MGKDDEAGELQGGRGEVGCGEVEEEAEAAKVDDVINRRPQLFVEEVSRHGDVGDEEEGRE